MSTFSQKNWFGLLRLYYFKDVKQQGMSSTLNKMKKSQVENKIKS